MSERFTAADLEPSREERRARRLDLVDRLACAVGCFAAGAVAGGLVALGASAAPAVFRLTPAPYAGNAMGAAFASFDRIAMGLAATALLAELVRTFVARRRARRPLARARRVAGIALAAIVALMAVSISPAINALHQSGATRGEGPAGEQLEALHARAVTLGRIELGLAALVVLLHVGTIRRRDEEDDEEEEAPAPRPPGPSS